jgi:hypothetical protein
MILISPGDMRYAGEQKREAMMAWCRANSIDPNTVSGSHYIRIIDDQIQYREQARSPSGKGTLIDWTGPNPGNEVATTFRQVPLVEPMPEEWPHCPTCGH